MTATVFSAKVKGAATHALVIGVGHYPHLPGGGAKTFANPDGMAQLASPPRSARAVARWLIEEYDCPNKPLGSVALLTSEKGPAKFEARPRGKGKKKVSVAPAAAAMPAVKQAILDWHQRGNANPDHLLLFYFCGHGIAAGVELALLMSDFGAKPQAPLDGALDFRRFHTNMEECVARHQCYFIDACRVGSALLKGNNGFSGDPVIQWTGVATNPNGQLRLGPILYSTLAEASAYARTGQVSIFTEALLDCLAGAGSGDESGPWEVQVTVLQRALTRLLREASEALGVPLAQIPQGYIPGDITLNTVANPVVPVFVRVDPSAAHALATLRCENSTKKEQRPPNAAVWRLSVPTGKYSFFADFKTPNYKPVALEDEIVRPPFWGKLLKVGP
jgi:hypothetical protein